MVLMFFAFVSIEANKKPDEEIAQILEEQRKMRIILATVSKGNENLPEVWPAKMNVAYPDFELFDQKGEKFLLSSLEGRVIILEYIDISSPVSQAQSGSAAVGVYFGAKSQELNKEAQPFSNVIKKVTNGAFMLPNDNILELKIIVYGADGAPGSRDDAEQWAQHFKIAESENVIVAVPALDMRSEESQSLVRGFQLLDKNLILRVDSSGVMPKHNLEMTLVPLVPKLIN
ncbi:MAG: hypothetical protein COB36_06130 [Alphaproteobacteria bacterium]|nr:MAG: hypothetical protein COB36_06130 [Alphaproteobacteria bacterium]